MHVFSTSALVGGEWLASRPCRFTHGSHCIGEWVDPRTLPGLELRPLRHAVYILLPYRLRPGGMRERAATETIWSPDTQASVLAKQIVHEELCLLGYIAVWLL
jgi:hypothetical protein